MVWYSELFHTPRLDLDIRSRGLDSSPDRGNSLLLQCLSPPRYINGTGEPKASYRGGNPVTD